MIMPYIKFNGNCEEAFNWYEKIFDGKIQHMAKYGDISEDSGISMNPEQKNKVMHAQVILTQNSGISGSDYMESNDNELEVFIQAHLNNEIIAKKTFSELSKNGIVISELAENPPPDNSGMSGCVKDKYGITWIVSTMKAN